MSKNLKAEVHQLHESRSSILKARVVGGDRPPSQASQATSEDDALAYGFSGAVLPPYDPEMLTLLLEHSNSLRQNIDAYVVNTHAHGYHFEPIIDLNSDDANTRIAGLVFQARQRKLGKPDPKIADPNQQAELPTAEEVAEARKELEEQMGMEKSRLKRFFTNCSLDVSFDQLCMMTEMDKELIGNGYWEVLRDEAGEIAQFNYIAGQTMRLMPLDPCPIEVTEKVRVDDVTWGEITRMKRFRVYVQTICAGASSTGEEVVFFKELGDPRLISRKTGQSWVSLKAMTDADPTDGAATEVLHFKVHSPRTAYGVPRWIGQLLAVLGSRQVDEINFDYFNNKGVPPLAFLVSGGRVTEETVNRLEDHISSRIRGKDNFHKVLFIEAEGANSQMGENTGRAKIEMKPLTGAQHNDALFQKYDERNIDKVGMAFRLPRMLRGDIRDFNRATADAALNFAEKQVFAPLRAVFDFIINRKVLPRLGIRFYTFKSNAPELTDSTELGSLIAELTKEGVLTPFEARQLSQGVFNKELRNVTAPWTRQPIKLTLGGIAPPAETAAGDAPDLGTVDEPVQDTTAGEIALTGTDLASIVTVNEMRNRSGLGDLKKPDGSKDPDGLLTVAEFKAKRTVIGEVEGEQEATGEAVKTTAKNVILDEARWLLNLRSAMTEVEEKTAEEEFNELRDAEYAE